VVTSEFWLFAALGAVLAGIFLAAAWSCHRSARQVRSARRIATEIDELRDALDSMRMLLKRINSREAMREYREKQPPRRGGKPEAVPDWRVDPEGFRRFHEAKINQRPLPLIPEEPEP